MFKDGSLVKIIQRGGMGRKGWGRDPPPHGRRLLRLVITNGGGQGEEGVFVIRGPPPHGGGYGVLVD